MSSYGNSYTRTNAWNNGGTFNNPVLLWYAKGVGVMQQRALADKNSWWFFAAIHGEYVDPNTPWYQNPPAFPDWGFIQAPPKVPTTPLPTQDVLDLYWDQCQHQSWYFPPWHRGYLFALEAQIREAVLNHGGPSDWALPYWNYFGPGDEYKMPPAFAQKTLPDGSPNPLFVLARYGPRRDGNIFVPIPPVLEACLGNDLYTGTDAVTPRPGFGGPNTGFSHQGETSGNLESNPHNQVHGYVGGTAPGGQTWGLMSDPGLAALDPIFYLHHCNIDRMWASWNAAGNSNPTEANWLNGPASIGEREFVVPMPGGNPWVYTPADVNSISQLDYTYDDLTIPVPVQPPAKKIAKRLSKLGAAPSAAPIAAGANMDSDANLELVGAHDGALEVKSSGARATVKLEPTVRQKVSSGLAAASDTALPDHVYLQLENVRGNRDSYILRVSVNGHEAGTVSLFGLRRASLMDAAHGGKGLTFILDITNIIDNLFLDNTLDQDALDVKVVPNEAVPDNAEITIGRISVYRQGQQ
jgi:tyrosinase